MGTGGFRLYQEKWETAAMLDYKKMVASMHGDLGEYKKTLRTDLVWIESGKYHCSVSEIKLICELSSIDTTYLLPCLKLYSKMVAQA